MNKHTKKIIAPAIIVAIIVAYYIFISVIFMSGMFDAPLFAKVLFVGVPLCLSGVAVYVLVERIKEIRSGEEDDLGKY